METLTTENARAAAEEFIATIPEYKAQFSGRGIVMCAGSMLYFTCAWVCINMLRRWGCNLPIQLWYLGEKELTGYMESLVKPLGVECIDGLKIRKNYPARILNGWELKAYSIIHSSFKEVMLLDADNVPTLDPSFLFESAEFKKTGAIFWPDYGRLSKERLIWKICGVTYRDEPEFETGQILVDKERCWKALCLSMWYNEHSDFFYQHIHGDKETFHLAFHKLNQPYSMPNTPIHPICDERGDSKAMCQHDFEGNRIFQHRNCDKWNLFNGNKSLEGFLFEDECRRYLEELRCLWHGHWVGERIDRESQSGQISEVYTKIVNTVYDYQRVGYDHRPMTFLKIGAVGRGNAGCEVFWDLKTTEEGQLVLEISSYTGITCRLIEGLDNIWRGRWLHHEQMPVILTPIGKASRNLETVLSRDILTVPDAKSINFAIMTVARPKVYIHDLITSLRHDLQLKVVVGSPDHSYLERYENSRFLEIVKPSQAEWNDFKNCIIQHRASWNYWRSLAFGCVDHSCKGLVVLEDDVIPASGWERRLYETIDRIEAEYAGPYALALYTSAVNVSHLKKDAFFIPYLVDLFYGTQAMYYPDAVRVGYANYLKENGVDSYSMPYDLLLKDYLRGAGIQLFAAVPSLFQHMGTIGTGLGGFHQAQQFQPQLS